MDYITGEENQFIKMYNNWNIMNDRFIEEYRNDLLQMNGGNSATQSTSKTRSTKTDNKVKANLSIRELSDRLKNSLFSYIL